MSQPIALYAAAAALVTLLMVVLVVVLIIQRRRHRQLLLLALAQEQAERRRKKRRKAGLHRWEIDIISPEALVSTISTTIPSPTLQTFTDAPDHYVSAITNLRRDAKIPAQPDVPLPLAVLDLPAEHTICPICLEDLQPGQRARVLPCEHSYHSQCIRVWLRRKNSCPCCCERVLKRRKKRVKTDPDQLHQHHSPPNPHQPEHVAVDMHSVDKTPFTEDRPRPQQALPRNVSLLDPADPDSEMLASEASSAHFDEPPTHDLLVQVRNAMRGGPSMRSVATSVDDDHSDDDMRSNSRKSSSSQQLRLQASDPLSSAQDIV